MTPFSTGYFNKMAQEGISPADARMIAEFVSAKAEADRKREAMRSSNPLRTALSGVVGAGKGAIAGGAVAGIASYISRLLNKQPVGTGQALDQAVQSARFGLLPGAIVGGAMGAVK